MILAGLVLDSGGFISAGGNQKEEKIMIAVL